MGIKMELQILHAIQGMHNEILDPVMIGVSALGNAGLIWILLALLLLCIPRTRKCGGMMLAAMALSFLLGNIILKNLIARGRPFTEDTSVSLLIREPGEYSFPSGHTLNGFTAATTIFLHYRKPGILALLFAGLIAFSRMYLFVHYPTDILAGIILGAADALLVYFGAKWLAERKKKTA